MKRFKIKWIITVIVLVIIGAYLYISSGYSISEAKALEKSFPNDNGEVVSEFSIKNDKIVIWKGQNEIYAKLLHKKWNFLYRVITSAALSSSYPDEEIKRTWTANLNTNKKFNTMLAVEIEDPKIVKIVITNENIDNEILYDLNEVKKISNIYLELKIKDGYAASYEELDPTDAGGFVFRGIDDQGNIKYVGR